MLAAASLLPAIFGLVGVAVGAVLTGMVEWARESRGESQRARAAARLLRADLFLAARMLTNAQKRRAMPGFIEISVPSWREHRDLLANALDSSTWGIVALACSRAHALGEVTRQAPRWAAGRLKAADLPRIEQAITEIVKAHDALGPLAEDPESYRQLLEFNPPLTV